MKYIEKICERCNKSFNADLREHNRGNAKYCSLSCVGKRIQSKIHKRMCINCREEFSTSSNRSKYCSKSCKLQHYRSISKTENYSSKTLQNLIGFLPCEICGWNESTRDVHHIIPVSQNGKNTLDNVIVLCPNHHRMIHKNLISKEAIEIALKSRLSLHPEFYQE